MSVDEVWQRVTDLSGGRPLMVSLSGGNPAIQPLGPLIARGHAENYRFALETQGSIARDWFADLDVLVLSPKPPSSGMTVDWAAFDACLAAAGDRPQIAMKIIVFDEADYRFAQDAAARYPGLAAYLQPGNPDAPTPEIEEPLIDMAALMARMRWLVDRVAADRWFDARVLPQLHVLIWGNQRGV